ncbi:hypothetical protein DPMN_005026 [Dreissena polymorpha]|uniref:Uncharacterized protein n=1 Tax=Dreissena polymorpha TaxID=45954 RepID=A0A9D4MSF8_DREPO|nr:hypothetical protein DPMN_005026 [Dreissena polymorpha]
MERTGCVSSVEKIIEENDGCVRVPRRMSAMIHSKKTVVAFCVAASDTMSKKPAAWWFRPPYGLNGRRGVFFRIAVQLFPEDVSHGGASHRKVYEFDNSPSTVVERL